MPVAIVTGSDSGIGKSTAVALARGGFDVGVTWRRDETGAAETAREVEAEGRRAEVRRLDLLELGDVPGGDRRAGRRARRPRRLRQQRARSDRRSRWGVPVTRTSSPP